MFEDQSWLEGFQSALELCYSEARGSVGGDVVAARLYFFLSLVKAKDLDQIKELLASLEKLSK